MPVNYGLLRGKVISAVPYAVGSSETDHYQVEIQDTNGTSYCMYIDVYSEDKGPDTSRYVLYYKNENYNHPVLALMLNCDTGFTPGANMVDGLRLDFLRYNPKLVSLADMAVVPPCDENGNLNSLNGDIDPWIQKAMNNNNAEVFAFGSGWDDAAAHGNLGLQSVYNPSQSLGIHDIHMNQGDTGSEARFNGIWQDGALFIRFIDTNQWVAMFFRFQNQSTDTDTEGNPN